MKKEVKKKSNNKIKKEGFFKGVVQEMKKVTWPDRKYLLKFTLVTLVTVVVCSAFFYLIFIVMSALKVRLG